MVDGARQSLAYMGRDKTFRKPPVSTLSVVNYRVSDSEGNIA